jgi:hypothetical protein
MKAEHFHEWYNQVYPAEQMPEGGKPVGPQPANWLALIHLTQRIFATGQLPTEVNWLYLTLIPKPQGGLRGIGLLETLWKLVEAIIDTRIKKTVKLHDALHGFCSRHDTAPASLSSRRNYNRSLCSFRAQLLPDLP